MQVLVYFLIIVAAVAFLIYVILPVVLSVISILVIYVGLQALWSVVYHTFQLIIEGHQQAMMRPSAEHIFKILDKLYEPQPAKMLYPLDGGWFVVIHLSQQLWKRMLIDATKWVRRANDWWADGSSNLAMEAYLRAVSYFVIATGAFLGALLYFVFTSLFWLSFVILASSTMLTWTICLIVIMCILGVFTWGYGNYYNLRHRCEKCHQQFKIPVFECPNCGEKHTRLWPSAYGIWSHCCVCGKSLSTLHLFGRRDYTKSCPICTEVIYGYGSVFHIPIFGGTSAGKSHFTTIATKSMLDYYRSQPNYRIKFPNPNEELKFTKRHSILEAGGTLPKTVKDTAYSVHGYNLEITVPGRNEPRLIFIYDIMGEHASTVESALDQTFLQFPEGGMILIIDPFSFKLIAKRFENQADALAKLRPSPTPPDVVVSNMLSALEVRRKGRVGHTLKTPLAVVMTKIDGLDLHHEFEKTLSMVGVPNLIVDSSNFHSKAVQSLLYQIDPNLVQQLHGNFQWVRYFAVSTTDSSLGMALHIPFQWLLEFPG